MPLSTSGRGFDAAYRSGKREAYVLGFRLLRKQNGRLLAIRDLTNEVKPRGENYAGVREVPVARIIGSEDRSGDFSASFLPINSGLRSRWTTVEGLLLGEGISDAIQLIEFGGFFFVRDGNHRVSVAKFNGIDYLDAEITRYALPVTLPSAMTVVKIPDLKAKLRFHERTHAFDYIPESSLGDARAASWDRLTEFLCNTMKTGVAARNGKPPSNEQLITDWYGNFYAKLIEIIRRQALLTLFPGKSDLDVFSDAVTYWQSTPEGTSPPEALREFLRQVARQNLLRAARRWVIRWLLQGRRTVAEERAFFFTMVRLESTRPQAFIHDGDKRWYRFLTRQVLLSHRGYLGQKLGRNPYFDELAADWYDTLYEPATRLYTERSINRPFPEFFVGWMSSWKKQVIGAIRKYDYVRTISLEESLQHYLDSRR